jgi:single-strand DNA-binding protein
MDLNRITLIGFIGIATNTSWKNDAGSWESRTEWHRCVAFGKLADFAGTLTKGAHVAIEGELRSHEYQRELAVGTQKTTLTQRVWEVRVDSVLKLDRAAKREISDENQEEVPR